MPLSLTSFHLSFNYSGVKVDGKITRLDEEDEEDSNLPEPQVYLPNSSQPLTEGQVLEPDQSAYEMLHRLNVRWPCLSFDILQDHLGSERNQFPHEAFLVAGTNAGDGNAKENELMIMKASSMWGTGKDGGESYEEGGDFRWEREERRFFLGRSEMVQSCWT